MREPRSECFLMDVENYVVSNQFLHLYYFAWNCCANLQHYRDNAQEEQLSQTTTIISLCFYILLPNEKIVLYVPAIYLFPLFDPFIPQQCNAAFTAWQKLRRSNRLRNYAKIIFSTIRLDQITGLREINFFLPISYYIRLLCDNTTLLSRS